MRIFGLVFLSFLVGCSSTQKFELSKVQQNLQGTIAQSEAIAQKAQADYNEKKLLLDNLARGGSPVFKQNERDLRARLAAMDRSLQNVVVEKKNMSEANGEIASLAYSRPSIHSGEPEYPRVEESVQRFEEAAKALNASLLDYSRESNNLAGLITERKLYFNFDVADFQKRVAKNVGVAQQNQKLMQSELTRAENIAEASPASAKRAQLEIYGEMRGLADDYSLKGNRLSDISREVNDLALGRAKISTLEPEWPATQKLVAEFDGLLPTMTAINDRFHAKMAALKKGLR